jgi:hypothetical protein
MINKLTFILFALFFISGCQISQKDQEKAAELCIKECRDRLDKGEDFSRGPCLSSQIIPDWVCDIAHNPRRDIDNQPENQCSAFRERTALHFVELDENCSLIRIY